MAASQKEPKALKEAFFSQFHSSFLTCQTPTNVVETAGNAAGVSNRSQLRCNASKTQHGTDEREIGGGGKEKKNMTDTALAVDPDYVYALRVRVHLMRALAEGDPGLQPQRQTTHPR